MTAATALSIIETGIEKSSDDCSYQHWALEEAREHLIAGNVADAVHRLGDAIDHAHRPGWTEKRPEVAVCIEAFRLLTVQKGGAA